MAELGVHSRGYCWALQLMDGARDLLSVGEQPIPLERREVVAQDRSKRLRHSARIEELVLDDVNALQERFDRSEEAVASGGVKLTDREPIRFSRQEGGELIVVENVVGLEARDMLLEQPEAVRVDGAD